MGYRENRYTKKYKLTRVELSILSIIDFYDCLSVKEISNLTKLDQSQIYKKIDKLINYELIYKIDYDTPTKYTRL